MSGYAQNAVKKYESEWKKVDGFVAKGLSQSALVEVNKIYDIAKKEKQDAQIVKALVTRLSLEQELKEDQDREVLESLKAEISTAQEPVKSILYSLLAQAYRNQYESLRWTILGRTNVAVQKSADPSTWSADDFMQEIAKNYLKSIEQETLLKATPLSPLDAIIEKGNVRNLRPTLYDLLVHEALDFFETDERTITKPSYSFEIDQAEAFADAEVFAIHPFNTRDSLSLEHKALVLYQSLLRFHLADTDPSALIDADIQRISFVYRESVHPDKEQLFMESLERMSQKYRGNSGSAQVVYLLAQRHLEKAETYQPYGDTSGRYGAVTALGLADSVIKAYPKSEGGVNLHNLRVEILAKDLSFETEKVVIPGKNFLLSLQYKNVSTVHFRVVKATERLENILATEGQQKMVEVLQKEPIVKQWSQNLPDSKDYQHHRVELKGEALSIGSYYLVASSGKIPTEAGQVQVLSKLLVSNLSFISQNGEYFVVHRESGAPLEGVKAQVWRQNYSGRAGANTLEKAGEYTTDRNGYFKIARTSPQVTGVVFVELIFGEERLKIDELQPTYNSPQRQETKAVQTVFFFNDRSIYRPGQTVYFKGILLNRNGGETRSELVANRKLVVRLFDANAQKVDSLSVTTNEFGSVAGHFALPMGGVNGQFRLEASGVSGAVHFQVEEYKRPKYKVEIAKPVDAYRVNEEIVVSGQATAFAGNAIDGAVVKYRVERVARFPYPWRFVKGWWPMSAPFQITSGETTTDTEGKFKVAFRAIPDKTVSREVDPVFDYVVYADVTDGAGETRSTQQTVSAAYKSVLLTVQLPEKIERDSLKLLKVKTENMNGVFLPTEITLTARKLTPEARLIRSRLWERPDQFVWTKEQFLRFFPHDAYDNEADPASWKKGESLLSAKGQTKADGKWEFRENNRLSAGFYELEFVATTEGGETVKEVKVVEVTELGKKEMTRPQYVWGLGSQPVAPGQKAIVHLGSSADKLFVIKTIERRNSTDTERNFEFLSRGSGVQEYVFPTTEEDRGGYGVSFLFIKHNRVHEFQDVIKVPWTNKELAIRYGTFRDKTLPGSEETWTLTIEGSKGEKVATELLAGMYDASLDEFTPHQWQKPFIWMSYMGRIQWNSWIAFGGRRGSPSFVSSGNNYKDFEKNYDQLIGLPSLHGVFYSNSMIAGGGRMARQEVALASAPMEEDAQIERKVAIGYDKNASVGREDPTVGSRQVQSQPVRQDFRETAFFFPQLRSGSDGSVRFTFKLPEALTKWKFQALGHTKELAFGYSTQEIVTQKELMVQPNIPRFLRVGDSLSISAKVVNLSDRTLNGHAKLFILNAATGESLNSSFGVQGPEVSFSVEAGQSSALLFPITIPKGFLEPVTVRITAEAGEFSDGEDNVVPVLTNQMLVTESLPLSLRGTGSRSFKFDKLLNSTSGGTLQHHNLTVEYTGNPTWYAIQALPYLMEYPYDCAEQTWNRYYANALAAHITKSSPRIEQVFKSWRDLDTSALLSNLQKNQELKSLVLEETPWVLEAKSEAEQKRNIALLFDLVKGKAEAAVALAKLQDMQRPDGSFPWFMGGPDDRFVTQYILTGIGHLHRLAKPDDAQQAVLNQIAINGLAYLDSRLEKEYDVLVKSKTDLKKYAPDALIIQYLYMRSFYPELEVGKSARKAYDYYLSRLPVKWVEQTKYLQAMMALTLSRTGASKEAAAIMKSLKQTAIRHAEMGTYWKNIRRGWSWMEAPIEQHALLVEAFEEVAKDREMADGIRTWLLTNKQTNRWESTKATAEACYSLLLRGSDWLNDNPEVKIQVGSRTLSSNGGQEAGTGYFKTVLAGTEVSPEQGNVKVTVSGTASVKNRPSWGGVYWQYFEDLDKITFSETPLTLKKQLFIEENSDRGPVLKEIAAGNKVSVGDKLKVRIVLSVDRDMEYVHMKDMRASSLEPVNVLSGYKWQGGLGYYESTKDAATNFFFNYLPKGTYVFEYPLNVTHQGDFSNGVTTVQCMYAPEFTAHSEGMRLKVSVK
jgi:uncharacterized protein YfaS (alpha-2-macroglobulin family)